MKINNFFYRAVHAIAGGGRSIVRVDVSTDGGRTWNDAELMEPNQPRNRTWAWTQWKLQVPVSDNDTEFEIICKAVDSAYNTQPESFQGIYNARGVLVTAWQRIRSKISHENK
jgi:sulfite oxidase